MTTCSRKFESRALTLIEVLVILAVIAVLMLMLFPAGHGTKERAPRIQCVNNLKQVGIAFRIWAGDHNDNFPMQLTAADGGTREFVGGPETFRHFEVMSNELNTPKLLFCPDDTETTRTMATIFGETTSKAPNFIPFTGNSNLSYFVGVDAVNVNPQMLLSGDRNLTNGTAIVGGLLTLTTNHVSGWTTAMHNLIGNVGLADGSVQGFTSSALQSAVANSGIETNRLAMP